MSLENLMTAHRSRRCDLLICNLLKISIVILALFIVGDYLSSSQLAQAVRIKGLIYNRDGKFIYRPSRANQAHIIVIDDRSPKVREGNEPSSKTESNNSTVPVNQEASPNQLNPLLLQLLGQQHLSQAAGLKTFHPGGGQLQLINLNDLPSLNHQVNQKEIANRISSASPNFLAQASNGGVQVVPLIQFIPQPAIAAINSRASQSDGLAYNPMLQQQHQQITSLPTAPNELGPIGEGEHHLDPYRMSRSSGYDTRHLYFQMPSAKHRLDSAYAEQMSRYGPPTQMQLPLQYPQPRIEPAGAESSLFDEQLVSTRGGGNPFISQNNHQQLLKARRSAMGLSGSEQVQDLDDVEGDNVEYYDTDRRGSPRGLYAQSGGAEFRQYFSKPVAYGADSGEESSSYKRHGSVTYANLNEGLAARSAGSSSVSQQSTSLSRDAKPVAQSKRLANVSNGSKLKSPSLPNVKQHATPPITGGLEEPSSVADARDPKSTQYWKQYRDQFDII